MSKRWVRERKKEHYYKAAKRSGYRSRSAFKLKQMNERYSIISRGDRVVDLGAAPGGWSQVAWELVGPKGLVVGVDIQGIEPIDGVLFVRGDAAKPEVQEKIRSAVEEADVVISDMSPKITGNYSMDHARSIGLAEKALEIARSILRAEGNFVVKAFQGESFNSYFEIVKGSFRFAKAHSPRATRKSSSEIYVIGKGFRGR